MKGGKVLLFFVCAGMELCYLYAGATFATTLFFHQTFPFPEAVGSFLLAAILTLFSGGRGWRVIYVLGFQSLGFIPAFVRMVNVFSSWSDSFLQHTWLTDFFNRPSDAIQYFVFVLIIGWVLVFWAGGVDFARRPKDYATILSRFDRGLIAFFILFLTKFYLQAAQAIQVDDPMSGALVFPFLIFSLLAIGLARNQNAAQRNFLPGYQTLGVMLGFIVVILLAGAGLVFFCLPYLTLVAEKGNDLLTIVTGPFVSIFFAILTWLFGADFSSNSVIAQPTQPTDTSVQWSIPGWIEFIGRILAVGIALLVALVVLAIVGGLVYAVFLWLFSKTSRDQEKPGLGEILVSLITQLRARFFSFRRGSIRNARFAARLYNALRTWGRRSGSPHLLNETPNEYGARLQRRFPLVEKEIGLIVQAFNRQCYGEIVLSEQQLATAQSAARRLGSPSHWLMRVKAWFPRSSNLSGS